MQPMPGAAGDFATAMMNTGYFFYAIKITETLFGFLLLSGFYVPLALVVLAPVTLNIVLFHAFLAPAGMYLQAAMFIIHITLGWMYREAYAPLLKPK